MTDARRRGSEHISPGELVHRARAIADARAVGVLAALLSAGVYAWLWPMPPRAQLAMLGVAGFVVLSGSTLALCAVLFLVWAGPLLIETGLLIADDKLNARDLVSAASLLAFVLFAMRYAQLHARPLERRKWIFRQGIARRQWPALQLRPLSGAGLRVALASGLSLALLRAVPLEALAGNTAHLVPAALRGLVILWGLACAALTVAAAFAVVKWRRLSPQQAALYIRRALSDELGAEQAAIQRARVRLGRGGKGEG